MQRFYEGRYLGEVKLLVHETNIAWNLIILPRTLVGLPPPTTSPRGV